MGGPDDRLRAPGRSRRPESQENIHAYTMKRLGILETSHKSGNSVVHPVLLFCTSAFMHMNTRTHHAALRKPRDVSETIKHTAKS